MVFKWFKKGLLTLLFMLSALVSSAQISRDRVYYLAQQLIIDKKYGSAIDVLNLLLREERYAADGYFLRGVSKYNLGDIVGAEADFSTAIEINPVFTMAYQYRAVARSMIGNYNDALADFSTAIEIRPDRESIFYSRGVTYFFNHQFKEAIADFDYFIRRKPHSVDAYVNRGSSYLMLQDTVKAMENYNKAISTNIYDDAGYFRRGVLNLQLDSLNSAFDDLSQAIKLDSTNLPTYFYRALTFDKMHKPVNAIEDFSYLLSKDSVNSLTYFNRAILRSQIGDYNNALSDYNQVAKLSPGNVLVYFNRGLLKSRLGELEGAENDFTRAIELYPDFANAYLNRSNVRLMLMDNKGAKSDYDIANRKIEEYKERMNSSSFAMYADTSKLFSSLLSFDVDFGNKDFETISNSDLNISLLDMERFEVGSKADEFEKKNSYIHAKVEAQEKRLKSYDIALSPLADKRYKKEELERFKKRLEEQIASSDSRKIGSEQYFALAVVQHSLQQYSSAVSYYNKAIQLEPENPFYYMSRGVASAQMTQFISRLTNSSQQLVIDTDPANRLEQSKMVYSYSGSINDIVKAIELDGSIAYFYYNMAILLQLSDDLVGAIEQLDKAIELNPLYGEAYFNRGLLQLSLKDSKKALLDISVAGELGIDRAYEILKSYDKFLK